MELHPAAVSRLALSPDGTTLITVGNARNRNGEVRIWELNRDVLGGTGNESDARASKR